MRGSRRPTASHCGEWRYWWHGWKTTRPARTARAISSVTPHEGEDLVQDPEGRLRLLPRHGEGGVDAEVGVVDHADQPALQALLEDPDTHLLVQGLLRLPVLHELDADEEAFAVHVPDHLVALLQVVEPGEHPLAQAGGILDELVLFDDGHGSVDGRAGHRITAVARAGAGRVAPRRRPGDGLGGGEPGHREAGAEALAHGHDVGLDVGVLASEPPAGAPEPGDHLVADEERVALTRDLLHGRPELPQRHDTPRRAPDRVHDDGG